VNEEPFEPHEGHHEAHDEHEHGLSHTFLEKAIHLRSMDPGLLALTVTAVLVLFSAAVLLLIHKLPMPVVSASLDGGAPYVPVPILIATAVYMTLAWSYILTGALHAHVVLRVLVLLLYSLVMVAVPFASGTMISVGGSFLVLVAVWAMAITLFVTDRIFERGQGSARSHRAAFKVPTFLFFFVATGLMFLIAALGGAKKGGFGFFIDLQLTALQFVLIPMLYLAGTDFAEWSEVVAGRVGSLANHLAGKWAAVGLAALVMVAGILIVVERYQFYSWLGALVIGAHGLVALGLMSLVGWAAIRRRAKVEIPFAAVVTVALLGMGSIYAGSILAMVMGPGHSAPAAESGSGGYVAYAHTEKPTFTIERPADWTPSTEHLPDGRPAVVLRGTDASGLPVRFVVLTGEAGTAAPEVVTQSLQELLGGPVALSGEARQDGQWQAQGFSLHAQGTDFEGTAWTRVEGSERWVLAGVSPIIAGGSYEPQFAHVVEGWKPEAAAESGGGSGGGESPHGNSNMFPYIYTIAPVVWLVAFVVSIFLIRRGGRAATAGLFVVSGGIFFLGYGFSNWFGLFTGDLHLPKWVLATTLEGVTMTVAAVAVVGVLFMAVTRRLTARYVPLLRLVLVLLLGLVLLRLLYGFVFAQALAAGKQFTIAQALVLMLALLWDAVMSGENLTNRRGHHVPRHSRVLMFFGYIMLVATAVLFLNSRVGGKEGSEFESDVWPQLGIQLMGLPLLVTFFFVNVGAWLRRSRIGDGDPVERSDLTSG
jgi:hypothetical protein